MSAPVVEGRPLAPGAVLGIIGGGQLARMIALAAADLGIASHIFAPQPENPAFDVAAETTVGAYDDPEAIARFAKSVDVVTCEFENVPAKALEVAARESYVFPPPKSFETAQDRLVEKDFVSGLGIAVAPGRPRSSRGSR